MAESDHYLFFSYAVENLLFKGISVHSKEGMFGLCFGVALFTLLYEGVKSFRHYLVLLQLRRGHKPSVFSDDQTMREEGLLTNSLAPPNRYRNNRLQFHVVQSLLHMLQVTLGYMVMLIVMTFNMCLLVTIVLTSGICFYFHEFVLSRHSMILPVEIPETSL